MINATQPLQIKGSMTKPSFSVRTHLKLVELIETNPPPGAEDFTGEVLAMWIYLAALLVVYVLSRWYRERQIIENMAKKYVFITGCDSGFGNQLARQLDARGLQVLAACLTQKGAEQLENTTSERVKTTILDVTSTESVAAATEWVKQQVGDEGLWGLVNNAGIACPLAPNEWLNKADFVKVLEVNLLGAVDVTLHLLPLLRKGQGRLVNVSSMAGRLVFGGGGYSPSKFAMEAFSDSLRRELYPFGVKVSIIEPGGFKTGIGAPVPDSLKMLWSRLPDEVKAIYGEKYFKAFMKMFTNNKTHTNNYYPVTNAMEHALISCYPRTRYAVGWDAKYLFIPLSFLPASFGDYFAISYFPRPAGVLSGL
ncbi:retinol dehydrogenase 7-like [Sceloporus undulatus]|uniref:retinol dehydrogenase 7-like n=1 Tax=Sceloporus undulatus TaxID=8520 RepID=UPI001C4CEFC8|nr:retinol dehydrogenase 7-like [Sceloporus undulatus]